MPSFDTNRSSEEREPSPVQEVAQHPKLQEQYSTLASNAVDFGVVLPRLEELVEVADRLSAPQEYSLLDKASGYLLGIEAQLRNASMMWAKLPENASSVQLSLTQEAESERILIHQALGQLPGESLRHYVKELFARSLYRSEQVHNYFSGEGDYISIATEEKEEKNPALLSVEREALLYGGMRELSLPERTREELLTAGKFFGERLVVLREYSRKIEEGYYA